jgi:hypothetical protein
MNKLTQLLNLLRIHQWHKNTSPRSVELHDTTNLIYTTPLVIFGIFRFLYLVLSHQSGEDPSSQIFKDKQLVVTVIIWALTYGFIIS